MIVDSSVAAKWYFPEAGSTAARDLIGGGSRLMVPDLILPELANICWKKVQRGEATVDMAIRAVAQLTRVVDIVVPSDRLAPYALRLSLALGHPAYDCFYLSLATQAAEPLITADSRLLAAVRGTPWHSMVRLLGEP